MEKIVMRILLPGNLSDRISIDAEISGSIPLKPHDHRNPRLLFRCNHIGNAMQIQAVFTKRLTMIRHIEHGPRHNANCIVPASP